MDNPTSRKRVRIEEDYEFNPPLVQFIALLKPSYSKWVTRPIFLLTIFLIRWAVSLGPYSGSSIPPNFGDFEAQRHWMEITLHLPIKEWYHYDDNWWKLDYPPLTAYISWICGTIGNFINSQWFEWDVSRGMENDALKVFMRITVVLCEFVFYVPAVIGFIQRWTKLKGSNPRSQAISMMAILFQPALILIDHGHFQYNSVMLGLALVAGNSFLQDSLLCGAMYFVLALSFKQMALYYAPAVFAYLLGLCMFPRFDIVRLCRLALTVMLTLGAIFSPLIISNGVMEILPVLKSIFPFHRGLWEDKVANIWCAANILVKLRESYSLDSLKVLSLLTTLLAIMPSSLILFMYPKKQLLPLGLSMCALSFYLVGFQVHEKSILLPLMPVTMLIADGNKNFKSWIGWINNIGVFSLWPLLRREGLALQYFVTIVFWNWFCGMYELSSNKLEKTLQMLSYLAITCIHILDAMFFPPLKWPDLWIVANVVVSCGCFVLFYIWGNMQLFIHTMEIKQKQK